MIEIVLTVTVTITFVIVWNIQQIWILDDVHTLSYFPSYPKIFPFNSRGVFFLALQGSVLLHRIPFSY